MLKEIVDQARLQKTLEQVDLDTIMPDKYSDEMVRTLIDRIEVINADAIKLRFKGGYQMEHRAGDITI